MISKELYFKFFESCKIVDGVNRSLICDLQRKKGEFIPRDLSVIIQKYDGRTISEIKKIYSNKYDSIIEEYFDFLNKNEYIFFTENPELFPKMESIYHNPFEISNSIIDVGDNKKITLNRIKKSIGELDSLKCKYLEIRFYTEYNLDTISNMLNTVDYINGVLNSIILYLPYSKNTNNEMLDNFFSKNIRVCYIVVYNSKSDDICELSEDKYIIFTKSDIINKKSCGTIGTHFFSYNIKTFSESQHHNTCLNRKISIDKDGYIRNCPSMPQHFGNIKDTTLEEALSHPDFKKYWNVTKDQIEVCKDCEFRHICTDCRAYTERTHFEGDIDLSKPLKCGYNPYTNEWAEWSTNPLKQKAIEYYGMQELVKLSDVR